MIRDRERQKEEEFLTRRLRRAATGLPILGAWPSSCDYRPLKGSITPKSKVRRPLYLPHTTFYPFCNRAKARNLLFKAPLGWGWRDTEPPLWAPDPVA